MYGLEEVSDERRDGRDMNRVPALQIMYCLAGAINHRP